MVVRLEASHVGEGRKINVAFAITAHYCALYCEPRVRPIRSKPSRRSRKNFSGTRREFQQAECRGHRRPLCKGGNVGQCCRCAYIGRGELPKCVQTWFQPSRGQRKGGNVDSTRYCTWHRRVRQQRSRPKWTIAGSGSLDSSIHTPRWRLEDSAIDRRTNSSAKAAVEFTLAALESRSRTRPARYHFTAPGVSASLVSFPSAHIDHRRLRDAECLASLPRCRTLA